MTSKPSPLGPSKVEGGFNIAVYSEDADNLQLIVFQGDEAKTLPFEKKTGKVWHTFVESASPEILYKLKVEKNGESIEIIDPRSPLLKTSLIWGEPFNPLSQYKCEPFDWENDASPEIPKEKLIIYEMHVRGFTKDPSSRVDHAGTYLGVVEKIPYLKDLGVNAVELMPVHLFNETEIDRKNPKTNEPLYNYWGYSTINFFAPMNRYGSENPSFEFKTMVKELHKNGIKVILDVVYNHTAEGGKEGPDYGYRALAEPTYYWMTETGEYYNDTGCSNTVKCTHPITLELIVDSLRHWVVDYHVDGFRFDLATVLLLGSDNLIEAITEDPVLRNTFLIAEAWDLVNYKVGKFYTKSDRWSEWNGKYRDCVRSFIKGDPYRKGEFAGRITGSQDLYGWGNPANSVNFITAHDGFTLRDLVSYNGKHNLDNGEDNQDGLNDNYSWNCGCEGPSKNKKVNDLRERQMKNLAFALFISRGIPMLHMGDEAAFSKKGNNNTWCQDNAFNWFNWNLLETNKNFYEFVKKLIKIRLDNPEISGNDYLTEQDISWHGIKGPPNWHADDRYVACTLKNKFFIAFNASSRHLKIELPPGKWKVLINTANEQEAILEKNYDLPSYSSLLLERIV